MTDQMTQEELAAAMELIKIVDYDLWKECQASEDDDFADLPHEVANFLQAQRAEALKERDAALAHCAMLREALERLFYSRHSSQMLFIEQAQAQAYEALTATQAEADAFIQRKVAEAVAKWLPMETAPKNSTVILAYQESYGDHFWIAVWSDELQHWEDLSSGDWIQPTHWQPLPQPPAEQAAPADAEGTVEG